MRFVLVFAFLLFTLTSAIAAEPQQETAAMLQQDLSRACPHGYMVVNGKCTPPCEQGLHRNLAGRCVGANNTATPPHCGQNEKLVSGRCVIVTNESGASVGNCPQGQELVADECKSACLPKQVRDDEGICVARCPHDKPRVKGKCPGDQGLQLN